MLRRGRAASIVNMGSTLGLVGAEDSAAYVASKHAVVGLTKAAALDYAKAGIRINAVCPGPVQTAMMFVHLAANPALIEETRATMPIGRFVEADEVAAAVVWLCSPAAAALYGQALTSTADGRRSSHGRRSSKRASRPQRWRSSSASFQGEVITPQHPGYDGARRVWNGMIDRRPLLIARPRAAPTWRP